MKNRKGTSILALAVFLLSIAVATFLLIKNITTENNATNTEDVKGDTVTCTVEESDIQEKLSSLSIPRKWYVKSPLADEKEITLVIPYDNEQLKVIYTINDIKADAVKDSTGWSINIPISTLSAGEKELIITADFCNKQVYKELTFLVSEPVYVAWTIDWEGLDVEDRFLNEMSTVSKQYSIPMTHFFNPNIYINLSRSRSQYLTSWVKERNTKYSEEIGLHLHMYNQLVKAAGVTPNNSIAWGSWLGNGHDTPNSTYGYNDYKKIIMWSIARFNENGLDTPEMFRAGGWYIDEENIQVLNDLNFKIESSGRTYYKHGDNQLEGHWDLKSTTQPYQLNKEDQNNTTKPNLTIWEFPNNGGDSWAYSSKDLTARFLSNYKGGIETNKKVVTFLSHPHWFDQEGKRIKTTFEEIKKYNYRSDSGPVIYVTLDKAYADIVQL